MNKKCLHEESERCVICSCDSTEVILKKSFHMINNFVFFSKKKCFFPICNDCKIMCQKYYGKNYCPICRNKKIKLENHNTNTNDNLQINTVDNRQIIDITFENQIIKLFNNKIIFEEMTKSGLLLYFFFSLWFGYFVLFPTIFGFYLSHLIGITNQYCKKLIAIFLIAIANHVLIKMGMYLFYEFVAEIKNVAIACL